MYQFFDVLHNDDSSYIIIQSQDGEPHEITLDTGEPFARHECSYGRSRVYECKNQPYSSTVRLNIDGTPVEMAVSKYPSYKDEIIMATCVKCEDDYVVQWIEFHKKIGISRFIFYDNFRNTTLTPNYREGASKTSDLKRVLREYIEDGTALVIDWPYEGGKNQVFQPGQQAHSINAFKTARYIGLLDVDEYVTMAYHDNVRQIFKGDHSYSLRSRCFYNIHKKPTDGYEFLKIYTCTDPSVKSCPILRGDKVFIYPRTAYTTAIHCVSTPGHHVEFVNPKLCVFNHYVFLNKLTEPRYLGGALTTNDEILRFL